MKIFLLFLLSVILSSCQVVTSIFNAGMGFGIFIVIAIILLIVFGLMKLRKK